MTKIQKAQQQLNSIWIRLGCAINDADHDLINQLARQISVMAKLIALEKESMVPSE